MTTKQFIDSKIAIIKIKLLEYIEQVKRLKSFLIEKKARKMRKECFICQSYIFDNPVVGKGKCNNPKSKKYMKVCGWDKCCNCFQKKENLISCRIYKIKRK
jgi:hypothetical protein